MEEINSDKESFYSADSLENLTQESKLNKNNTSLFEDKGKDDVLDVPFYEVRSDNSKISMKTNTKMSNPKRGFNSNKLAFDNTSLTLDLRSLRGSSASIPSKCRSSSVEPGGKVHGLISSNSSKTIDPKTNVIRTRNRSVSYLEQYRKRLSTSCNRNSLHSPITPIEMSNQNYSHRQNNNFTQNNELNGSHKNSLNAISVRGVEMSTECETQSFVSTDRSSKNNIEKREMCTNMFEKSDEVGNFLIKLKQNKQSFDYKLASLKKRKEYGEVVKKKNQEELFIQKAQSKTKVQGTVIDKIMFNNEPLDTKVEKPLPPVALIEKRKQFSEKVKHKNREDFINQKIQHKAVNVRKTKENMITNEECFTQNIDKYHTPVKQRSIMTQRKKESLTKIRDHSKNLEKTDLKALQMRHEKDKIKAKDILDEFLKT